MVQYCLWLFMFTKTLKIQPTVSAVRSQGPPTQTRKGTRPARRNDNPDVGLPSGADVPDGRRLVPGAAPPPPAVRPAARPAFRPATKPVAKPAPMPVTRPARMQTGRPAARPAVRPVVTRTRAGPPPPRRNDNPDFGLPSGRDFPDAGFKRAFAPAPAPYNPPVPAPYNPPVPAAPAAPAFDCDYFCQFEGFKPVCTIYGNEYDNDCYRNCRNEPRECENTCPCNKAAPTSVPDPIVGNPWADPCDYCATEGYDPVCVDDEKTMQNECYARCEGKTPTCSSSCPC